MPANKIRINGQLMEDQYLPKQIRLIKTATGWSIEGFQVSLADGRLPAPAPSFDYDARTVTIPDTNGEFLYTAGGYTIEPGVSIVDDLDGYDPDYGILAIDAVYANDETGFNWFIDYDNPVYPWQLRFDDGSSGL